MQDTRYPARYWHRLDDGRLQCDVCPRDCRLHNGQRGCKSVAFTYNDPVIFVEYAMDAADACRARGVHTVAVTAGYMHDQPRRDFYTKMDAANVDLKAFTEDFYFKLTSAHLQPVLDTLVYIKHDTDVWLEITTLAHPRPQRQQRRNHRAQPVGHERTRPRCAAALLGLSPRLQNAGRARHASLHAGARPHAGAARRAAPRLHRQRPSH